MFIKITSNTQKTKTVEEIIRRKEERIAALVSSRRIYRIEHSDVFWVESSKDNEYHYCKINFTTTTATEFKFCSCEDFKYRGKIRDCCHLEMIPIGIMRNKIVDIQSLPIEAKKDCNFTVQELSYLEDVVIWKMNIMVISEILNDYNLQLEEQEELCPKFVRHIFERQDSQFISKQVVEEDYVCLCGEHKYVYNYLEDSEIGL